MSSYAYVNAALVRMRTKGALGMLVAFVLAPVVSSGQTIFNTFGPAETFNSAVPGASVGAGTLGGFPAGGITLAVAFTPAVSANLSRVDLGMQYVYVAAKSTGAPNLNVTIASDDSGSPGAAVETIAVTGALSGIPNAVGIVSANSVSQPFLTAGTRYWLIVAPPDLRDTTFDWYLNSQGVELPSTDGSTGTFEAPYPNTAPVFAVFGTQNIGYQPDIAAGGVVDAASFRPAISPGSWFSIFGTNLSPKTRSWQTVDFLNGALPLSLSGVAVQVNGIPAAVSYISPGQINAQVPDGVGPGAVTVQVITPAGTSSLAQVNAGSVAPGFFTYAAGGATYVAATFPDGTIVGTGGTLPNGVATRPAKPGDVISLWGTGFGPTAPNVAAGSLFSGAAPLIAADQPSIMTGDVPASVQFAGLAEAGLYQLNVTVPDLPDGNQPIVAQIAGSSTQQRVYLTIRH